MFNNVLEAAATGAGNYSSILFLVVIFVVFYFFLIRPENKRKKQLTEMRNALSLGDEIVTIGGMMGKVVQVTDETVTFETGEDRVRIQVTKWAISTNARVEKEKAAQQQKMTGKKTKADVSAGAEENSIGSDK